MARVSPEQWKIIETEWRTGAYSNVDLAKHHGITETAIRKRAISHGWIRDLGDATELRAQRKFLDGERKAKAPEKDEKPSPLIDNEDSAAPDITPSEGKEQTQEDNHGGGEEPPKFEASNEPPSNRKPPVPKRFDEPNRSNQFGLMEEVILEQIADRRATENLSVLNRADDIKRVRTLYLGLIHDVMSGDEERVAKSGPVLLMGRGDSLSSAIKALAALDESLQKVMRLALGMDKDAKHIKVSGPDGGPIRTETTGVLDVSALTTEQLAALTAVNAALDGDDRKKGIPMPPGEPEK